ncbi:MAG: type II CAAX prenyl endopeptidase Rce1 family protein [Candidatus Thorarchaeota archaeon]
MSEKIESNEKMDFDLNSNTSEKIFKKPLLWFFVFTFIWSWLLFLPNVLKSFNIVSFPDFLGAIFSGFAIFGPTIIALIITAVNDGKTGIKLLLKKMIQLKFSKIWFIPTIIIPLCIAGAAFLISIGAFGYTLADNYYNVGFIVGAVFISFFVGGPLAEELGWRGFALDHLQNKWNALTSSIILGIIWSLWHLPLHFIIGTTQYYIPIWAFLLMTTTSNILYTWLYNNTNRSILITMLFHWFGNIGGALLPYWQLGVIESTSLNSHYWLPTYGMLVGFAINLVIVLAVIFLFKSRKMMLEEREINKNLNENGNSDETKV